MISEKYKKFIVSPEWKKIRKDLFKLRGKKCEICGSAHRIEVHHLNYKRFGGDEKPEDLQILCKYHHELIHGKFKPKKKHVKSKKRHEPQRQTKAQIYFETKDPKASYTEHVNNILRNLGSDHRFFNERSARIFYLKLKRLAESTDSVKKVKRKKKRRKKKKIYEIPDYIRHEQEEMDNQFKMAVIRR